MEPTPSSYLYIKTLSSFFCQYIVLSKRFTTRFKIMAVCQVSLGAIEIFKSSCGVGGKIKEVGYGGGFVGPPV